jgi:hypothetical protein
VTRRRAKEVRSQTSDVRQAPLQRAASSSWKSRWWLSLNLEISPSVDLWQGLPCGSQSPRGSGRQRSAILRKVLSRFSKRERESTRPSRVTPGSIIRAPVAASSSAQRRAASRAVIGYQLLEVSRLRRGFLLRARLRRDKTASQGGQMFATANPSPPRRGGSDV